MGVEAAAALKDCTGRVIALRQRVRDLRSAVIAYSGGVDSAVVAVVAAQELGARALAVTGRSPSLASGELEAAAKLLRERGVPHEIVDTSEFDDPAYRANAPDRCFHCKRELFSVLNRLARARGFRAIADGANADDGLSALDRRPGRQAAAHYGVRSPLQEAGLNKEAVRAAARALGLPVWNKPATPCLSSRVPYGTRIEYDDLRRIDLAERFLRASGFATVRVRHYGTRAVIEVPPPDIAALRAREQSVRAALTAVGYRSVEIDARGYRTGSLNAALAADPFATRGSSNRNG